MVKGFDEVSTQNPQQQQLFQQLAQMLGPLLNQSGNYFSDMLSGDDESFDRFAAPYKRQFNEEVIPEIAERFAGMGGLSSSGFQQSLGAAGAGLSENLASMKEGMRSQIPGQIFSNLQNLLSQNTKAFIPKQQKEAPFWQQLLLGATSGLAKGATSFGLSKLG